MTLRDRNAGGSQVAHMPVSVTNLLQFLPFVSLADIVQLLQKHLFVHFTAAGREKRQAVYKTVDLHIASK